MHAISSLHAAHVDNQLIGQTKMAELFDIANTYTNCGVTSTTIVRRNLTKGVAEKVVRDIERKYRNVPNGTTKIVPADPVAREKFEAALQTFLDGCQKLIHLGSALSQEPGARYIRIVVSGPGRSVYCFVDFSSGDVFKAASWKTPAKHARGNIFDAHNGLKSMGPFGPA